MTASCGSCSLCCTLLGVPDIGKAPRMRCWNTTVHGGCKVHGVDKPQACVQFSCLWLSSQEREAPMPRHLRPDQCHVVLGPQDRADDTLLYVQVDPAHPTAWKAGEIGAYIQDLLDKGARLEVIVDEDRLPLGGEGVPVSAAQMCVST